MARVRRYDRITLDASEYRKPAVLPNGFLKTDAVLTRTGVFPYRLGDGSTRRELRLPEEVGSPDSLASFQMLPVTDDHPPAAVTKDNVTVYQRGSIGDTVAFDGRLVSAPILITERNLVGKIQAGVKDQVSLGYDCDLEMTPGTHPEFGEYDAIQRGIVGNHVAIVALGRAGPAARVRMDAADGEMEMPDGDDETVMDDPSPESVNSPAVPSTGTAIESPAPAETSATAMAASASDANSRAVQPTPDTGAVRTDAAPNARRMRMKIRIDGMDYEPEQVPQALERRDAAQAAQMKAAEDLLASARADAEKARKDSEAAVIAAKKDLDTATARADSLKSELDKAEKARTDAASPEKFSAAVRARVALETKAARVLGSEFKADALDEPGINAAILKKLEPDLKLDGKSADYVQARVDFAVDRFDAQNPGLAALRTVADPAVEPGSHKDINDAIDERQKRMDERARHYRSPHSTLPAAKH